VPPGRGRGRWTKTRCIGGAQGWWSRGAQPGEAPPAGGLPRPRRRPAGRPRLRGGGPAGRRGARRARWAGGRGGGARRAARERRGGQRGVALVSLGRRLAVLPIRLYQLVVSPALGTH